MTTFSAFFAPPLVAAVLPAILVDKTGDLFVLVAVSGVRPIIREDVVLRGEAAATPGDLAAAVVTAELTFDVTAANLAVIFVLLDGAGCGVALAASPGAAFLAGNALAVVAGVGLERAAVEDAVAVALLDSVGLADEGGVDRFIRDTLGGVVAAVATLAAVARGILAGLWADAGLVDKGVLGWAEPAAVVGLAVVAVAGLAGVVVAALPATLGVAAADGDLVLPGEEVSFEAVVAGIFGDGAEEANDFLTVVAAVAFAALGAFETTAELEGPTLVVLVAEEEEEGEGEEPDGLLSGTVCFAAAGAAWGFLVGASLAASLTLLVGTAGMLLAPGDRPAGTAGLALAASCFLAAEAGLPEAPGLLEAVEGPVLAAGFFLEAAAKAATVAPVATAATAPAARTEALGVLSS